MTNNKKTHANHHKSKSLFLHTLICYFHYNTFYRKEKIMETSYTLRERKDTGNWQAIIRQKQGNAWKQVQSKTFVKNTDAKQWAINTSSEWQKKIENDYDKMTIRQLKDVFLEYKN